MKRRVSRDPMVPDEREKRLVSWAAETITALRRQVADQQAALDAQSSAHAGSEVKLRRYRGGDVDDVPLESGSRILFTVPHPLFPEKGVQVEAWVEKSDRSLRRQHTLILNAHFGSLKITPAAANMVYIAVEDY